MRIGSYFVRMEGIFVDLFNDAAHSLDVESFFHVPFSCQMQSTISRQYRIVSFIYRKYISSTSSYLI
jgi:hypothetical protein